MRNVVLIVVLSLVMLTISPAATSGTVASVQFSVAEARQKLVSSDLQSEQISSTTSTGFVKVRDEAGCTTSPYSGPAIRVVNFDPDITRITIYRREPNLDPNCKDVYPFAYSFETYLGSNGGPNLVWHGPIDDWNPELGKWELKEGS